MKKNVINIIITITIVIIILTMIWGITYKKNKENLESSKYKKKFSIIETSTEMAKTEENVKNKNENIVEENILKSVENINLHDLDGKEMNYVFTYKNKVYSAIYTKDNWHIVDSYEITNKKDIEIICRALINIHPIQGKDMISYRTVDDLSYEWIQHNIAYMVLPEENIWKKSAKDVDLNPEDQNKSFKEIYEDRTGRKLNINELIKSK